MVLAGLPVSVSAQWRHPHGESANTGFSRVDTLPAQRPRMTQPLGHLAPGVNPVVGNDGMVYVGNLDGEIKAFNADGTPAWTRQLYSLQGGIYASPVISSDGSVYVISTVHYRDHRGGVEAQRVESYLHKFTPGGGWLFTHPFPEHNTFWPEFTGRGATNAAPNIWFKDGLEVLMAPVTYKGPFGRELRLIAFSTEGNVLADQRVTYTGYEVTGGSDLPDWLVGCYAMTWYFPVGCVVAAYITEGGFGFEISTGGSLANAGWPLPNVAVWQHPQGGTPWIMVADGDHDVVGYTFSLEKGFYEYIRVTDKDRNAASSPVVLPDGHTAVGDDRGTLSFAGPNGIPISPIKNLGAITAAPTHLNDGRLAVVSRPGYLAMIRNYGIESVTKLNGESIASAAASCTHLFISTTEELVTYDVTNMVPVASVPWFGGGLSAPVIGPTGYVYAVASDVLFVFQPPAQPAKPGRPGATNCGKRVVERGTRFAR
jgi:outer membrane protein assembly factor BamB